jgi:thioredoxin reductase
MNTDPNSVYPIHSVRVAIIGAGPSGIGVALGLARRGVKSILLIDRNQKVGGIPAIYRRKPGGVRTFVNWVRGRILFGDDYARWLRAKLVKTEVAIWLRSKVIAVEPNSKTLTLVNPCKGMVRIRATAIVLACGAREQTLDELGWLGGSRLGRIYYGKSVLELLDQHGTVPVRRPVIIGSDLNAYAVAAKLKTNGAANSTMLDTRRKPKCPLHTQLYFRRWESRPNFIGGIQTARLTGRGTVSALHLDDGRVLSCDGIVLSGDLVPNSELALMAQLDVAIPSRRPRVDSMYRLSAPGLFAAGNLLGGFHGAEWCYFNGLHAARSVARYVEQAG